MQVTFLAPWRSGVFFVNFVDLFLLFLHKSGIVGLMTGKQCELILTILTEFSLIEALIQLSIYVHLK